MATRRRSSKVIWMRSGWSSASICWVLLASGRFAVSQTIIPEAQEHFLTPSAHRDTHIFGGLGLREITISFPASNGDIQWRRLEIAAAGCRTIAIMLPPCV